MLAAIVRWSLRYRGLVLAGVIAFLGYGIYALTQAKYDVFPEFAPPQVSIQTEAPGLAPEQVEVLVTQPLESALNGTEGIEALRSESIQGLSVITLTFATGRDLYRDRQSVAERLATLGGQLPQGVQAPVISPMTSSTGDLLTVGLTSEARSLMEMRTIAEWTLRPRLLAVAGVSKVSIFGGEVKQLQIQVRPESLVLYNVGIGDVLAAAHRATGVRGAGSVDTPNQRIVLQTEGQALTPQALAQTALMQQAGAAVGLNVTLGDVATVVEAPEPPISAASIRGQPGVILNLWAQYGANTLEATRHVERVLEETRPLLQAEGVALHADLFRPANFIHTAVRNVQHSLVLGAILVVVVLVLFLSDLRTAAISCVAIPLSLLGAVIVLQYLGLSLNTMTIGGLAIAIGAVVDDAVIDVENIQRRLREHRRSAASRSAGAIILDASLEVRSAVVYATFAVIMVFLPIFALSGLAGRLFAPLGLACVLAILASLLVALVVTPALCLLFLGEPERLHEPAALVSRLKRRYEAMLARAEQSARSVLIAVAAATLVGVGALCVVHGEFLPELREGHFLIHMRIVPGTSLTESLRVGRQVSQALLELPVVRTVAQRVGRAALDDTFGTHESEFEIDLMPVRGRDAARARSAIRQTLARFPGVTFGVNTFLTERIEETLSGYTAAVIVNVFGDDLDVLDRAARDVAAVLGQVPGAADVQVQSPPGSPQLMIRLKPEVCARWGFEPVDVLDAIRTAYQGELVGQVYQGSQAFGVAVVLDPDRRKNPVDVGALPLRNPTGVYVRLRELCEIRQTSGRYVVLRNGARRVQTVTCNAEGRSVEAIVQDAKRRIASAVPLPAGAYVEFTGAAAAQAQSRRDLLVHSLLAGAGMLVLLMLVMRNARNAILAMANVPFALIGGVVAVLLSGGRLSMGSLVGFVTLFGISLRNSIMLLSHYEHLVRVEGAAWGPAAVVRGASERLIPIVMTALVTALGLLPLALGSGEPGREIEGPMAIVILGGLVTSTMLNLFVLPLLAQRYGRFHADAHHAEG